MGTSMTKKEIDRRRFLRTSLLGGAGAIFATSSSLANPATTHPTSQQSKAFIKRKLGKTGIELPVVSMGVMRADNPAVVHAALKAGIVHFDTAHGYMRGKNEEMLGEVFKGYPRDSFVLATKVVPEESDQRTGMLGPGSTSKAFLEKLDISLKRLNLDYVDILYVHNISSRDAALFPPMLEALTLAKKSGKAKHVGLSTHKNEPDVIQAAIEEGIHEVVLTSINFKQDHYQKVKAAIANAAKAGIGIVAMKTMAGGFHDKEKTKPVNCKAALKFVLQDENVTTTIPGIINFDQLAQNVSVNEDLTMNDQERADVTMGKAEGGLYCQGCEHCVPDCPKHLPIPELMRAYMYTYGYSNVAMAHSLVSELGVSSNPCKDCSSCSATCVKGFHLSERITDVSRLVDVPAEFIS
jgi:predicted aldo/keto reductase-like oxidoreductase